MYGLVLGNFLSFKINVSSSYLNILDFRNRWFQFFEIKLESKNLCFLLLFQKFQRTNDFHEIIDQKKPDFFGKFLDFFKFQEPWFLYQNWLFEKYREPMSKWVYTQLTTIGYLYILHSENY